MPLLPPLTGDIDCLAEFARTSHGEVNDYDDEGQAPLHVAADRGDSEAVNILTGNGADIDVPREEDNRTPLHIAVNEGHAEVVAALLEAGAKVNSEDFDGWLALHVACYYGAASVVDMLLRRGTQVRVREGDMGVGEHDCYVLPCSSVIATNRPCVVLASQAKQRSGAGVCAAALMELSFGGSGIANAATTRRCVFLDALCPSGYVTHQERANTAACSCRDG